MAQQICVVSDGEVVQMSIGEWLEHAGIDLDKRMDAQKYFEAADGQQGDGEYVDKYPMVRLSGVSIIVTLNYYQRKVAPKKWKISAGKKASRIICIMDVVPRYGYASLDCIDHARHLAELYSPWGAQRPSS